jgi:Mlc titration factor MtfA (ptsG expression regulator)
MPLIFAGYYFMPPDTSHIPFPAPLIDAARDSLRLERLMDSLYLPSFDVPAGDQAGPMISDWPIILFILVFMYLVFVRPLIDQKEEKTEKLDFSRYVTVDSVARYDEWLSKYNPYYQSLDLRDKKIFLERTVIFLNEKDFRFHAMVEEEYIPVLISGAAVQMTFGLRNYLMDYFPVIHVIRKEYVLDIDKETYYGHVSRSGIYISWNHFLEGYSDYGDSVNVGLHEMAHAVSYDLFLGEQDRHDLAVKERLKDFSKEGTVSFRAMKQGMPHIFDEYALTNFDEFWAVCVENFFENPVEFQESHPALYQSVCNLLNQNPLIPGKIIDRELAGLAI